MAASICCTPGTYLCWSKARGAADRLIVGLNADVSVRQLKGPGRPVQSEVARATVLASLKTVDAVVIFAEETPLSLIEILRPDVLVKGADYSLDNVVGAESVLRRGGKVLLADLDAVTKYDQHTEACGERERTRLTTHSMPCSFVVSLRAFGDFVICCRMVRMIRAEETAGGPTVPKLLVGEHVRELAGPCAWSRTCSSWIPARATGRHSISAIRATSRRSPACCDCGAAPARSLPADCRLIFDQFQWREKFIAARYSSRGLVSGPNIYVALSDTLRQVGYSLRDPVSAARTAELVRAGKDLSREPRRAQGNTRGSRSAPRATTYAGGHAMPEIIELTGENLRLPADLPGASHST